MRPTADEVLDDLASGVSDVGILSDLPDLSREAIRACLAFAGDERASFLALGWRAGAGQPLCRRPRYPPPTNPTTSTASPSRSSRSA